MILRIGSSIPAAFGRIPRQTAHRPYTDAPAQGQRINLLASLTDFHFSGIPGKWKYATGRETPGSFRSTQLFNRQFRDTLVFVFLNQYADNFHERSERVRLVFSDFID